MSKSNLPKHIVAIIGPTASGKTSLALDLAKIFPFEIISADARQIYRYMDIGTAKPTLEERQQVPHHLIDITDPDQNFDAWLYREHFLEAEREIISKGKLPLVVGGSGLYLRAALEGIFEGPGCEPEIRANLKNTAEKYGSAKLHEKLKEVDPEAAERIHPADEFRIIRALEVYESTGQPISEWQKKEREASAQKEEKRKVLYLNLKLPRLTLKEQINQRVEIMIKRGLVEEVKNLLQRGYNSNLSSMKSIGYAQICSHLQGKITIAEAISQIKIQTQHYAKRQITWFNKLEKVEKRKEKGASFFDVIPQNDGAFSIKQIKNIVEKFYVTTI